MREGQAKKRILPLLLLLLLALLLLVTTHGNLGRYLFHLEDARTNAGELKQAVLAWGPLAPAILVALQVLQVILAPFPGETTGLIGGYLFGAWPGFLYSTIGLTAGSAIAFGIGRLFGDAFKGWYSATATYRKFNHLVHRGDFAIPFFLMLFPGFPKDSLSYLLGFSAMPFRVFFWIALFARIPGTLVLSLEGANIAQEHYFRFFLVILVYAAISLPCVLYHRQLLRWLAHYSRNGERLNQINKTQ